MKHIIAGANNAEVKRKMDMDIHQCMFEHVQEQSEQTNDY